MTTILESLIILFKEIWFLPVMILSFDILLDIKNLKEKL